MITSPPDTTPDPDRASWISDLEAARRLVAGAETIKVGVLTPLSLPGDIAAGTLFVRGARLGVEYVHERGGVRGGKELELVVENDQATAAHESMARSAVGGLAKLALCDRVIAVIGQWHHRTAGAVADASAELGVPVFIETGHDQVTRRQHATVFRTFTCVSDRVPAMLAFIQHHGLSRVAMLSANTTFGLSTADAVERGCAALGVELLRMDFDQESTQDVTAELRRIKDFAPDIIIDGGVVRTCYLVLCQAHQLGLFPTIPMMATFSFPSRAQDFWRLSRGHGTYLVWVGSPYRPGMPGMPDMAAWFTRRYHECYGSFPPDTALCAFNDIAIIAQAVDRARDESREALIQSLETGEYDNWHGPIRFERGPDHWHHSPPPVMLLQYHAPGQDFDEAVIVWPPEARTGGFARVAHERNTK